MTAIDVAIIIGGPLAFATLNCGIPVLADRLYCGLYCWFYRRRLAGGSGGTGYVAPYRRRFLLAVAPAEDPCEDVLHGISGWQSVLSSLHIKAPHALCGESLVGVDMPSQSNRTLPRCPRCVAARSAATPPVALLQEFAR